MLTVKLNLFKTHNAEGSWTSTVPSKQIRMLSVAGNGQVVALSSAKRGALFTEHACVSATGNLMPVMIALPRAKENKQLMETLYVKQDKSTA
jgi:hypothetical protein